MQTNSSDQNEAAARPPKKLRAPGRSMKKRRKVRAPVVPSCSPVPPSTPPPDPLSVKFYTETGHVMPDERAAAYRGLCDDVANGARLQTALRDRGISWGAFAACLVHYKLLHEAWSNALSAREQLLELLIEDAAHERAVDGVDVPVVSNGVIVTHKKVYSDGILAQLLQGADLRRLGPGGAVPPGGNGGITIISRIPEPQMLPEPSYIED